MTINWSFTGVRTPPNDQSIIIPAKLTTGIGGNVDSALKVGQTVVSAPRVVDPSVSDYHPPQPQPGLPRQDLHRLGVWGAKTNLNAKAAVIMDAEAPRANAGWHQAW